MRTENKQEVRCARRLALRAALSTMTKLLLFAFLFLIFASCRTREVVERTVMRDTTIWVHVAPDTLSDTVIARDGAFSILSSGYANSVAWINSGKLFHRLNQPEKHLPVTIKQAVKTTTTQSKLPEPTDREKEGLTRLQRIQVFLGNVLLFGLGAFLLLRLFRGWGK